MPTAFPRNFLLLASLLGALAAQVVLAGAASAAVPQLLPGASPAGPQWSDSYYGTSLSIPLTCGAPTAHPEYDPVDPAARCTETFPLTGSIMTSGGAPIGKQIAIGEVVVDIAQGEQTTATVRAAPAFFNTVVRPNPGKFAGVRIALPMPQGGAQIPALPIMFRIPPTGDARCGVPHYARITGPAPLLRVLSGSKGARKPLRAAQPWIPAATPITADKGPISFTVSGVKFSVAKGSTFRLMCISIGSVSRGAMFLAPELESGTITVTGKPTGKLRAANVVTEEGALGTRSQERTNLVVTRSAKTRVSRLHVRQGRTGGITPSGSTSQSPCTSGARLQINRAGRITAR